MDQASQRGWVDLLHPTENRGARFWKGRKFKPEPGGISSGQDGRTRRCADRVRRVAVVEHDPFVGERVDVRSHEAAVCRSAVMKRKVVESHVVGQDQDDIGRTFGGWEGPGGRALLPLSGYVFTNGIHECHGSGGTPDQQVDSILPTRVGHDREEQECRAKPLHGGPF